MDYISRYLFDIQVFNIIKTPETRIHDVIVTVDDIVSDKIFYTRSAFGVNRSCSESYSSMVWITVIDNINYLWPWFGQNYDIVVSPQNNGIADPTTAAAIVNARYRYSTEERTIWLLILRHLVLCSDLSAQCSVLTVVGRQFNNTSSLFQTSVFVVMTGEL